MAFIVADSWQGQGVGGMVCNRMIAHAKEQGLEGFEADVLQENAAMMRVFHRAGLELTSRLEEAAQTRSTILRPTRGLQALEALLKGPTNRLGNTLAGEARHVASEAVDFSILDVQRHRYDARCIRASCQPLLRT